MSEMKLPEGIGFTWADCFEATPMGTEADYYGAERDGLQVITLEDANTKLPELFQEWCEREGVKVYACKDQIDWRRPLDETDCDFDWEAYLMPPKRIEK